mmetsp:Transcript_19129/g.23482  ORF Transcript_19129/g.23482 Transcript_19129/m.23482 type:complete len:475 (+) Transcript_19129:81-1505(+)
MEYIYVVERFLQANHNETGSPTVAPTPLGTVPTFSPTEPQTTIVDFVNSNLAAFIASICAIFACIVSGYNIHKHLVWYTQPHLQKSIIRILFIVPFYAIFSLFSLFWPDNMVYFELIRDIWEAVVIYSFLNLMLEYCGGENACLSVIMNEPGSVSHIPPFNCCFPVIPLDASFLRYCKQATIQFVIIKPLMAVINLILISLPDGQIDQKTYEIGLAIVYNLSYTIALYFLALFYKAIHHHPGIVRKKPLAKFAAVKMVVFLTYYQTLVFSFVPVFYETGGLWNSFVLCCEMVIFAILHLIAFNWSEYKTSASSPKPSSPNGNYVFNGDNANKQNEMALENAKDVMSISDVAKDAYYNFNMKYGSHVLLDTDASSTGSLEMVEPSSSGKNKPKKANNIFGNVKTTLKSLKTGGNVGGSDQKSTKVQGDNPFGSIGTSDTTSAHPTDNPFIADYIDPLSIQAKPPQSHKHTDLDFI